VSATPVAVDQVSNKIYLIENGGVVVMDGATNAIITTIPLNGVFAISGMALNSVTNQMYLATNYAMSVMAINLSTYATITVPTECPPWGLTVNPTTNQIYGICTSWNEVTVIDGATNMTEGTVPVGTVPGAAVCNPITNKTYVANALSNDVSVLSGKDTQVPLYTTIAPLPDDQTGSQTPTFNFTASSQYLPIAPPPEAVYFQVDTWQGPWTQASGSSPNFKGQTQTLSLGTHTLYAFAGDGQEAGINGNGTSGQLAIGNIAAYPFAVVTPSFGISNSDLTPSAVNPGQTATSTITITSFNGFNSSVSLTCHVQLASNFTNPPLAPTCTLNPTSVTPAAGGKATSTLTVNTTAATSALGPRPSFEYPARWLYALLVPVVGLTLLGVRGPSKFSRKGRLFGLMLGLSLATNFALQTACGGGSGNSGGGGGGGSSGTPAGTYEVVVAGTSGSEEWSTIPILTVQ